MYSSKKKAGMSIKIWEGRGLEFVHTLFVHTPPPQLFCGLKLRVYAALNY